MNDRRYRTQVNKFNRLSQAREAEINLALGTLMTHPQGRRLLYWLLSLGKIGHNPFSGHALSTVFACGEMNVAQQLQDRMIEVDPANFTAMLVEMENERLSDDHALAAASATGDADDVGDDATDD